MVLLGKFLTPVIDAAIDKVDAAMRTAGLATLSDITMQAIGDTTEDAFVIVKWDSDYPYEESVSMCWDTSTSVFRTCCGAHGQSNPCSYR